jgi:hypothetical protein
MYLEGCDVSLNCEVVEKIGDWSINGVPPDSDERWLVR